MNARLTCLLIALVLVAPTQSNAQALDSLSLESLLDVQIETASKYEQTISEAPASVTIITAEQIERFGFTSIAEALNSVPGFYLGYDHVRYSLGSRGFNRPQDYNNRALFLINGHTVNESLYGAAFLDEGYPINLDLIERIEVVRGPGSALYGTGAMFATINIVTRTPEQLAGGWVGLNAGTYGQRGVRAGVPLTVGDASLVLGGQITRTDALDRYYSDFNTPEENNGWAEGLDWEARQNLYANLSFHDWTLQAIWANSDAGVPNADFESRFNPEEAYFKTERLSLDLKRVFELSPVTQLETRGFFVRDQIDILLSYDITLVSAGLSNVIGSNLQAGKGSTVGTEALLRWDARSYLRFVVGTQYTNHLDVPFESTVDFGSSGFALSVYDGNFSRQVWSVYGQTEYQVLPELSLTAGLRQDAYIQQNRQVLYSPRLAAVYHPAEATTIKLLYGRAFREPTGPEREMSSPLFGLINNPDIRPERIQTTELVWEQGLGRKLTSRVAVYDYAIRDVIIAFRDEDETAQFRNQDRVEARGAEVELLTQPWTSFQVSGSYSYQWVQQVQPTVESVANAPRHLVKGLAQFQARRWGSIAAEVFAESHRETTKGTTTDGGLIVNANLRSRPLWDSFRVSMHIHNLLDRAYSLPGGRQHQQANFEQDGRRLTVRLDYTF